MKTAAILLAVIGLAVAGAAAASDHLSDVGYLKANRCRGLAQGLASGDVAGLDALIKTEGRSRIDAVYAKGQEELARGKLEAGRTDSHDRVSAELTGSCATYLGGAQASASAGKSGSSSH
jgi:hypothetical protein